MKGKIHNLIFLCVALLCLLIFTLISYILFSSNLRIYRLYWAAIIFIIIFAFIISVSIIISKNTK
jgi:hypothetical protein